MRSAGYSFDVVLDDDWEIVCTTELIESGDEFAVKSMYAPNGWWICVWTPIKTNAIGTFPNIGVPIRRKIKKRSKNQAPEVLVWATCLGRPKHKRVVDDLRCEYCYRVYGRVVTE